MINIEDFKPGSYIKCINPKLTEFNTNDIYRISKIEFLDKALFDSNHRTLDGYYTEYLSAKIIINKNEYVYAKILSRNYKKFLTFNWKNWFLPKIEYLVTSEDVNFVLATELDFNIVKYNL